VASCYQDVQDNGVVYDDGPKGERSESSCTTHQCKNGAGGAFLLSAI
jgi:hypothetical protein